jgi:hypothetical protein
VHAENRLGWLKFLLLFFCSAAFGYAVYALIFPTVMRHSLGASGGVFGVLAFYSFYLRRDRLGSMAKRLRIPAPRLGLLAKLKRHVMKLDSVFIIFWVCIARETIGLSTQLTGATRSNSAAHLSGALFGVIAALFWAKKRLRAHRNRPQNTSGHPKATSACVSIILLTPLPFVAARGSYPQATDCLTVKANMAAAVAEPVERENVRRIWLTPASAVAAPAKAATPAKP